MRGLRSAAWSASEMVATLASVIVSDDGEREDPGREIVGYGHRGEEAFALEIGLLSEWGAK